MAEDTKKAQDTEATDEVTKDESGVDETVDTADAIVAALDDVSKAAKSANERIDELDKKLDEASKTRYPYGMPNGGVHGIVKGESSTTSRPYSLMRLAVGLAKKADQQSDWAENCKVELDLSKRLSEEYYNKMGFMAGGVLCPLGSSLMPTDARELADGTKIEGLSKSLVEECRGTMTSRPELDWDEYDYLVRKGVLRKDLSANTATTGGTLRALPSQGELIELLVAQEVMSQVGAMQMDLPPQGRIRFPRQTGTVSIAAYAEAATVSESTPATSALELSAKAYSGLVDVPDELIRFSTSAAVEAWLRGEFTRELSLKADSDMISGAGGTAIQGVINYSAVRTVTASTTNNDGDTLDPEDPTRLHADIADQNAPIDRGFFYAMTNTLWGGLVTTRANSGADEFVFSVGVNSRGPNVGGGAIPKSLNGHMVVTSTQIPTNREKGSGSDLTLVLGGVGAEWVIARAGVVELVMTNSDASKFQQRLSTLRGTQYIDAGPRHENSFGMIDDLLNQ